MSEKVIVSPLAEAREESMINRDKWGAISSLLASGVPKKSIARTLGLHIQTVRRWAREGQWRSFQKAARPTLMDEHQSWAAVRLPQINYNAVVSMQELRAHGYTGGYDAVKRFVRPYREERDRQDAATVRFETAPGQQAQVDWGTSTAMVGGVQIRLQFFVMVLGYSRRLYARACLDQKGPSLLMCHEMAFDHFGGRTREILYDNPKTIVLERDGQTVRLNPLFEDFARYWGYTPRLCWPYRARTKGKVESGVKYVKRNFLAGKTFESMEQLNEELLRWCVEVADRRVHGTTHRIPADAFAEESLVPTTDHPRYQLIERPHRTVATDCLVTYETNRYSVPARLVGRTVDVVVAAGRIVIYHQGHRMAEHAITPGRYQTIMERGHYAGLFRPRGASPQSAASIDNVVAWPRVEERPLAIYEALLEEGTPYAAGGVR